MAIKLGSIGSGATPSRIRQWLGKIGAASALTVGASDASPAVVSLASHGLQSGDVVLGYGFTNNTNLNGGPFLVVYLTTGTFKLTTLSGSAINGGGSAADTGASIVRIYANHKWHDIENMATTLARQSLVRNGDQADPTYPQESTIQAYFGS
jgi:hypothetical protein